MPCQKRSSGKVKMQQDICKTSLFCLHNPALKNLNEHRKKNVLGEVLWSHKTLSHRRDERNHKGKRLCFCFMPRSFVLPHNEPDWILSVPWIKRRWKCFSVASTESSVKEVPGQRASPGAELLCSTPQTPGAGAFTSLHPCG